MKEDDYCEYIRAQFEQEYANSFLGTGNTLINADTLLGLRAIDPDWHKDNVNVYERPKYTIHTSLQLMYHKKSIDYSTFSIFDVTAKPFKQVCTFRDNMISPMLFPDLINKYCRPYNESLVIIENNAEGSIVATQLHYDIEYPNVFVQGMTKSTDIGITMSRKIKE